MEKIQWHESKTTYQTVCNNKRNTIRNWNIGKAKRIEFNMFGLLNNERIGYEKVGMILGEKTNEKFM